MEWNRKRFFVLFISLTIISLLFMILVYNVPANLRYLLEQSRKPVLVVKNKIFGEEDEHFIEQNEKGYEHGDSMARNSNRGSNVKKFRWKLDRHGKEKKRKQLKKLKDFLKKHKYMNFTLKNYKNDSLSIEKVLPRELQRFPNAIIIGSKKGGTRALLHNLKVHPKIKISGKEVHFFDRYYEEGYEWYRKQMPLSLPNDLVIEKTPAYFVTQSAPKRISDMSKKFSLDLKFLVILRDPVERAISDYTQGLSQKSQKRKKMRNKTKSMRRRKRPVSFESNVFVAPIEKKMVKSKASLIQIGLYAQHLSNWLKYFDIKKFYFVSAEDFVREPWKEMLEVQKFLNISLVITKESFWYNSTKNFYCILEQEGAETKKSCLGETKGRKHPELNNGTISALRKFFKPYNERFYQMTGKNFNWPTL